MTGDIIVALVVVTALGFDFTNGFHDTANAMATTIATGALRPKVAVAIAAVLNFVGAFISLKVAATVAGGIEFSVVTRRTRLPYRYGAWRMIVRLDYRARFGRRRPSSVAHRTVRSTTLTSARRRRPRITSNASRPSD